MAIPLAGNLFRYRDFAKIVQHIVSSENTSASSIAKATGVSTRTAWIVVKALRETGHLVDGKSRWMDENFITVNLRDVATDALFRFSGIRPFLYFKLKSDISLYEAAKRLSMDYSMVKKLAAELRRANVLSEKNSVRVELLRHPENPLDLIPRKEHRQAIMFYLNESRSEETLVMHGAASWGVKALEINLLALVKSPRYSSEFLIQDLVDAASATTLRYGFTFALTITTLSAWFENKLTQTPNETLMDAADGICVRGSLPADEDYFEYIEGVIDEERVSELLIRGYVRKTEKGFAYTDKALNAFMKIPASLKETFMNIDGKRVKIISASIKSPIKNGLL